MLLISFDFLQYYYIDYIRDFIEKILNFSYCKIKLKQIKK